MTVRADDVAAYILDKQGVMSAMKLQKLCYYSRAWHLVWDEDDLFTERIEAWANGPVVRSLYGQHRREFTVAPPWAGGNPEALSPTERQTVDAVLGFYGDKSAHWLSELTHREQPWIQARAGLPIGARSEAEITPASMHEYYDSL